MLFSTFAATSWGLAPLPFAFRSSSRLSSICSMKFLYAFGLNEDGQCYSATKKDYQKEVWKPILVRFPELVSIRSVSAGSRHTLAVCDNGHVYSWGWGHVGQLGHGDCNNSYQPKRVEALDRAVVSVSAGGMHSACVTADHLCYTWGCNTNGQLGIGKSQQGSSDEVAVPNPSLVMLIDTSNREDQIRGLGTKKGGYYSSFAHNHSSKQHKASPFLVKAVSCGGCHTGAIGLDGEVYSWGKADSGQTGCATWYLDFSPGIYSPYRLPRFIADPADQATDISCGGFFTLILTAHSHVYGMGKEDFGCLGMLCEKNAETPMLITTLNKLPTASLSAGGWHSAFVSTQGKLYTCGKGEYGRLGLGSDASSLLPAQVDKEFKSSSDSAALIPLEASIVQTSAGGSHTLLHTGSRVFTVGRLDDGRCATRAGSDNKTDRTFYPQDITELFYPGMNVLQVSAGGAHSLVLAEYSGESDELVRTSIELFLQ